MSTIIDLFSGGGGFCLGAVMAGFQPVLCVDNDEDLSFSFSTNFPHVNHHLRDLSVAEPAELLELANFAPGEITGVLGGPPCQGVSYIGKRDPSDPRNRLIPRFFRFVAHIQPAFFVMENVLGLLDAASRPVLDEGISKLPEEYHVLDPLRLNAADYGAATSRDRVFVIGYHVERAHEVVAEDILSVRTENKPTVYEAIHDLPSADQSSQASDKDWAVYARLPDDGHKGEYARRARTLPFDGLSTSEIRSRLKDGNISGFKPTHHTDHVLKRFASVRPGERDAVSKCPRLEWGAQCNTLRAGTGKERGSYQSIRPIHPEENRVISVREAARIQGFPDWFQFHPTKWHSFRMIGNSVAPPIGTAVLSVIRDHLNLHAGPPHM